jgi:nucleoid-associated protein YgaU
MNDHKVIIQESETLWSIAERELGNPRRWIEILIKNQEVLEKRVYVRAGTELEMPEREPDPSVGGS